MQYLSKKTNFILSIKFLIFLICIWICHQLIFFAFKNIHISTYNTISALSNQPFLAFFIGILSTALIGSSSTTTCIFSVMASVSIINIESTVFMVIGANIGTTIVTTEMSSEHFSKKKEFRKAIAAGALHDFFNIFTTILLLPLEYYFNFLSNTALYLASLFLGEDSNSLFSGLIHFTNAIFNLMNDTLCLNGVMIVLLACLLLYLSIKIISTNFKKAFEKEGKPLISKRIFSNTYKAFFSGIMITSLAQSSALITSITIPMVASNKLSLKKFFPFLAGYNLGTTFTVLIFSLCGNVFGLAIAFAHILFNLTGILVLFVLPFIRKTIVLLGKILGKWSLKRKLTGITYVSFTFFILPFILILVTLHPKASTDTSQKKSKQIKTFGIKENKKPKYHKP